MEETETERISSDAIRDFPLPTMADFDNFRMTCDSDSTDWRLSLDDPIKRIKVWEQRLPNSTISRIRMTAHMIGLPAETLYDVLQDAEYRKVWDTNMVEGYTVALLDPFNDIGYYAGRDFCNQRSWWFSEDLTEYIIMNHSVIHPDIPERKQYVRGWSYRTGYVVRTDPYNPQSSFLIYCTQTDLKGWIPDKLINKAIKTFAPNLVAKMQQIGAVYPEWKVHNDPLRKPWLSKEPYHWQLAQSNTHSENDKHVSEEEIENIDYGF